MDFLETIEIETRANPDAAIVWLHGLGADGNDFVPIVGELGFESAPAVRFVFPHAPMRPVTINNGYVMRAWYDITQGDMGRAPDERGIRESQAAVEALIAREKSRGVAASRIVLAGFSQGGAIALQAGLRHAERLGGIVALSTYLPLADTLDAEASGANKATPIFMAHGSEDPLIPLELADDSRRKLELRGYAVKWLTYPMPHSVCAEEVEALGEFFTRIFEPAAARASSSIILPR